MTYLTKAISIIVSTLLFAVVFCTSEAGETDNGSDAIPDVMDAGPTSVTIDAIRPFEEADGYTYVEATMHGSIEREDGSAALPQPRTSGHRAALR